MSDKYEIYEYEDGFKRVLKNGKAINEFGLLKDVQKLQAENAELRKRELELVSAIKDIPDKADPSPYLKGLDRPTEFAISQAKSRAIGAVMDKVRSAKKLTKGE